MAHLAKVSGFADDIVFTVIDVRYPLRTIGLDLHLHIVAYGDGVGRTNPLGTKIPFENSGRAVLKGISGTG